MKMAMEQGIELTKEQAEAYIADLDGINLDSGSCSRWPAAPPGISFVPITLVGESI